MSAQRHHARSRSPHRSSHKDTQRSRSPEHHGRRHRHHHHRHHRSHRDDDRSHRPRSPVEPPLPLVLPFKSQKLSRHDFESYKPMFASYIDIQKNKDVYDMDEGEVRGRWKSFVKKWNQGELAEGWYDPATKAKADASVAEEEEAYNAASRPAKDTRPQHEAHDHDGDSDTSSEDFGPTAPPRALSAHNPHGPSIPSFSDLADRDEAIAAARDSDRKAQRTAERKEQKARMEDILPPRAEPGTRERQLEKRREAADANRSFRDAKGGAGDMVEVGDGELMGAGGVSEVRALRAREERKKSEREIRREETLMARRAEREERLAGLREKEEKTMDVLRALARERFGGGAGPS